MKNGYPDRRNMQELRLNFEQYFKLKYDSEAEFCFDLLITCGLKKNDFKIGKTEVFIRPGKIEKFDRIISAPPDSIKSIVMRRDQIKTKWRSTIKRALLKYRCKCYICAPYYIRKYQNNLKKFYCH